MLEFEALVSDTNLTQKLPEYNHLFSDKLEDQINIVRIMKQHFGKRRKILEEEKSKKNTSKRLVHVNPVICLCSVVIVIFLHLKTTGALQYPL